MRLLPKMQFKRQYWLLLTIVILLSRLFPDFWQVVITGAIGFFMAYLITTIRHNLLFYLLRLKQ